MASLSWIRAARRLTGLGDIKELPYLEALMEAEEGQVHNDYRVLSLVLPLVTFVIGSAVFVPLAFRKSPLFLIGTFCFWIAGAVAWVVCDRMDKSIPEARKKLRKAANKVWERYRGFKNLIGVEPAIAPKVGEVLETAASIYLKHAKPVHYFAPPAPETSQTRCERAMEEAMAKMLDLAVPDTAPAQELELSKGWATSLLKEMRALDQAMTEASGLAGSSDPLYGLREARREIESIEAARIELEQ